MKYIYLMIGICAMVFGAIGVVLPILPTTPFLLLAAFCFAKSSDRFHNWFTHTSLYKNHLDGFVRNREMTIKTKASLLIFASTMLIIAIIMMDNIWLRFFIILLMIFKYYYFFFRIKTV